MAASNKLIAHKNLEVEITESAILGDHSEIKSRLHALQELGIGLSMDDFGTGFSSIDTLSKWPFSSLKIDQGVVGRMENSAKDHTIVHSSIRMAHELELDIVAEGIETESSYNTLLNAGCTIAQGYWIDRPMPLGKYVDFIKTGQRWPSSSVGLIYQAQLDHMRWRKNLIDGILSLGERSSGNILLRGSPSMDPAECRLGKWYNGVGKIFAGNEWYNQLQEPHEQLHRIGEKLLNAAMNGVTKDELMLHIRMLTEQSLVVIAMLQNIENELLLLPAGISNQ